MYKFRGHLMKLLFGHADRHTGALPGPVMVTLTFTTSIVAVDGVSAVTFVAPRLATLQTARLAVFWADCSTHRQNHRIPLDEITKTGICFLILTTWSV